MARLHGLADRVLARMVGIGAKGCTVNPCAPGGCIRHCCDGRCGACACP
ncbi:hypothetical protein LX16_4566 [Stackebrandtia albiflava]|uniref:Uncharacterized protein n=1 Tax=Stackebrandtia albiflava TaxID=406432 RepID=A0A562URW3_9ACTN|nr:hypothetical protein [Stackebrandtia albiflava]TWJ08338.1 hypothetical protein LX16_4566 [Stackebrandtia albiflava]